MFKQSFSDYYMLINGIDSQEYGLYVQDPLPIVSTAPKRLESITVAGRSGTLTLWDGAYDDITKDVSILFRGDEESLSAALIFLQTAQTVTFSNESDKVYSCRVNETVTVEQVAPFWHSLSLTLLCHPIKREKDETTLRGRQDLILTNIGNVPAYPTFSFFGITEDITLVVGTERVIIYQQIPYGGYIMEEVVMDGEIRECFVPGTPPVNANSAMQGEFPAIKPGEEVRIVFSGAEELEVKPNWGWV